MVAKNIYKEGLDKFASADPVKMVLDVTKKQLKFYKNDEETNIVFDNIDLSANYHLMIRASSFEIGSCQMMQFNVKNYDSLTFYSNC